jgi:hypothetical protein
VEDGDGEPPRVQRAGELQHRADVALERQRKQRDVGGGPVPVSSGHSRSSSRPGVTLLDKLQDDFDFLGVAA